MATNTEQLIATLQSEEDWQPNIEQGLERLRLGQRSRPRRRGAWIVAASATVAAAMAMPAPRAFAHHCLDCSVALLQGLSASGAAHLTPAQDRAPAPDFVLPDASGRPVRLSDFRGKVVLLDFWATWCHGCQIEIPWFVEFQQTYRDRGLVALGVSFDDNGWSAVRPWMQAKKVNYRIMVGNDKVAARFGGAEALPETMLIDRSGRIAAKHVGLGVKEEFRAEIEALLRE
jgi:cytochrome c biogenesis protein CcmG/thiol:disulfide interchange protein DsbE